MTSASKVWAHDLEAEPSLQAGCDRRPLRGPVGVAARFGGHTSNGRVAAQGPPTCGPGSGKGGDPALLPPERRRVLGRLGLEQALRTCPPLLQACMLWPRWAQPVRGSAQGGDPAPPSPQGLGGPRGPSAVSVPRPLKVAAAVATILMGRY